MCRKAKRIMLSQLLIKVSYVGDGYQQGPQAFMLNLPDSGLLEALRQIPVQQSLSEPPIRVSYSVSFDLVDQLPRSLNEALDAQEWLLLPEPVECNRWLTELEQVLIFPFTGSTAMLSCYLKHSDILIESEAIPVKELLSLDATRKERIPA